MCKGKIIRWPANFDLTGIRLGKEVIIPEDSIIGFIQLQQNNGSDYDKPAEDLPWFHYFTQKNTCDNTCRHRFQCCGNTGRSWPYSFDAFEIEPEGQNGSENTDKQYPAPLHRRVSVLHRFQRRVQDIPHYRSEQHTIEQNRPGRIFAHAVLT